jgi:hypothetical protein
MGVARKVDTNNRDGGVNRKLRFFEKKGEKRLNDFF